MPAVSTNIKIDPDVKEQAQNLFERLGMNLSTAVNIFLRQAIREQAIPFRITDAKPTITLPPTRYDMSDKEFNAMMERGFYDIEQGKTSTLHETFDDLRKGINNG